jgi:hypothetical protein
MDNPTFIVIIVIIAICLIIYHLYFTKQARVLRALKTTEEKDIDQIKTGDRVRVTGTVQLLGTTLNAPLSGRKCAYWHVFVESRSGKSSYTIADEEEAGDVILKKGPHIVVVRTRKINTYLLKDANYSSGFLNDATDTLKRYLKKHNAKSTDLLGMNRSITYEEGVLEEGETVSVAGVAEWVSKSKFRFKSPGDKILTITASEQDPVYMTDEPGV